MVVTLFIFLQFDYLNSFTHLVSLGEGGEVPHVALGFSTGAIDAVLFANVVKAQGEAVKGIGPLMSSI